MDGACLNCEAALTGPFCSSCGQRHQPRLSLRDWLTQAVEVFLELDGPALRTLRDMSLRPGLLASEYVDGRRVRYVNPMRYALLSCGAFLAVLAMTSALLPGTDTMKTGVQVGNLIAAPLLALPVLLVFARSGRSYADQLVLQLYLRGHTLAILGLVSLGAWALSPESARALLIALVIVLLGWQALALWQFHRGRLRHLAPRVIAAMILVELASVGVMLLATKIFVD